MTSSTFLITVFGLLMNLGSSYIYQDIEIPMQNSNGEKVDSLLFHNFEFLDQIIKSRSSYIPDDDSNIDSLLEVSDKESQIIGFFVELTIMEPERIYMYASGYVLDTVIIRRWKEWTIKNKDKFFYDPKSGKLVETELKP